jgi:hypothetical protein
MRWRAVVLNGPERGHSLKASCNTVIWSKVYLLGRHIPSQSLQRRTAYKVIHSKLRKPSVRLNLNINIIRFLIALLPEPKSVRELKAEVIPSGISLSWLPGFDSTQNSYRYQYQGKNVKLNIVPWVVINSESVDLQNLFPGERYQFYVDAISNDQYSPNNQSTLATTCEWWLWHKRCLLLNCNYIFRPLTTDWLDCRPQCNNGFFREGPMERWCNPLLHHKLGH